MARRVDFATQNLLGTCHRQRSDLVPQHIPSALHGERGFVFGSLASGRHDAGAFGPSLIERLRNLPLTGRANLGSAVSSRSYLRLDSTLCVGKLRARALCSRQAIGDLARAVIERLGDRRPHEPGSEPPQRAEDDDLDDQSRIQIHGRINL